MKEAILSQLNAECPWRDTLLWFDTIDSTNDRAKQLASQGAPHGTVLLAGHQTGGRGRMGRCFSSPENMGIYLSVILRPNCSVQQLMHLTCCAAVAACNAVEEASGFRPGIKWINDLIANSKKLGGILTELSVIPGSNQVQYAVVGIGINCKQRLEDFPKELQNIAISLETAIGKPVQIPALAVALVQSLYRMDRCMLTEKAELMALYKANCLTLGQTVTVIQPDRQRRGIALDLDPDGSLLVQFDNGAKEVIQSGEVSVRGLSGYL